MRISILAFSLFIPNSSLGPVLEDFLSKQWDSLRKTSSNPNIVSQCTCLNMNCYKYCLFIFFVTGLSTFCLKAPEVTTDTLRVAMTGTAPLVVSAGADYDGISVDIWQQLAIGAGI